MEIFNIKRKTNELFNMTIMFFALVVATSCGDDFLEENPPNRIVAENLFTDPDGFQIGLNGLYQQVRKERMSSGGVGGAGIRFALMTNGTDNICTLNDRRRDMRILNEYGGTSDDPSFGYYNNIFRWLYETINAANTIVNRAEAATFGWSDEDRDKVIGEAKVIRAWAYRHLTYLWGDVPITLEEGSGNNIRTDWERAPKSAVYEVMEEDLIFAETHLPDVPDSPGKVSSAVAKHYLAELYLLMGRADDAETKADEVITNGNYSLITARYGVNAGSEGVPFMDQFTDGNVLRSQGNTEVLWTILQELGVDNPDNTGRNIMRRHFGGRYDRFGIIVTEERGGRGVGWLGLTNWAIQNYEPEDDRGSQYAIRRYFVLSEGSGDDLSLFNGLQDGDTIRTFLTPENTLLRSNDDSVRAFYPYTRKWDWADPVDPRINEQYDDQPYIRLAETYLLKAEAQVQQEKLTEAAITLNEVRERSNASLITAGDVTIDFVLDERSRELLAEEHRRYSLKRTGKLIERVQNFNLIAGPVIAPRDTVMPIPQPVIDANVEVEFPQNPGYTQ